MGMFDKPILVFQTDFTYKEGAVSAMYGVVKSVDRELEIFDGTHEIPQYDTWSASYRLLQSLPFWPKGTIYVSVVDPGVGTSRRACVAKTANGYYVVTPDNGALTHIKKEFGILEVREIDERVNRLPSTRGVSIFHGRDLFGYTAARLASGIIDFEGVGPVYPVAEVVEAPYIRAEKSPGRVSGMINEAGDHFGLIGTNIPFEWLSESGMVYGDMVTVTVTRKDEQIFRREMKLEKTFGYVPVGDPLVFSSEMRTVMMAINQGNATVEYGLGFGPDWKMTVEKV